MFVKDFKRVEGFWMNAPLLFSRWVLLDDGIPTAIGHAGSDYSAASQHFVDS